jgi:GNAT superfamily N-acetyltransferase
VQLAGLGTRRKNEMAGYEMMDQGLVLPVCLHGGPVALSDLPRLRSGTDFEKQFGLRSGVHAQRLRELAALYGATGVVAVDGEQIVGLLRFSPAVLGDAVPMICPQDEPHARRLAELDVSQLPAFDDLEPKAMRIDCLQVVESHVGRGIGKALLRTAVDWCRDRGWESIQAKGLANVYPVMAWAGQMSFRTLERMGFEVVAHEVDPGIREGVVSQRLGYHGEDVKRMWDEQYADISDDQAATRYTLRLRL